MTNSFGRTMAANARPIFPRCLQAVVGLVFGATLGHAAVLYTFSETGANPYSFSFLEPSLLSATGPFAIPPFQVDGLKFTQATLTQADGTGCFQFGTAGASLTATPFSCGLGAFAPNGGWQSLFFGGTAPGTYTAFNAASEGSAPAAPDKLTITAPIPESATSLLCGAGLTILALFYRRARHSPLPGSQRRLHRFTTASSVEASGGTSK